MAKSTVRVEKGHDEDVVTITLADFEGVEVCRAFNEDEMREFRSALASTNVGNPDGKPANDNSVDVTIDIS